MAIENVSFPAMETTSPAPGNVGVEGADLSKLADEKQDL
jgi:hypothetical protein